MSNLKLPVGPQELLIHPDFLLQRPFFAAAIPNIEMFHWSMDIFLTVLNSQQVDSEGQDLKMTLQRFQKFVGPSL